MSRGPRVALAATFALALVGLVVSVALAIDYLGPAPAYCAASGCATVRASSWSHPLGVPMPVVGAAFFAIALGLVALAPRSRIRRAWLVAGGAAGLGLVVLQGAVIGAWCKLCMIVDGAAIALAVLAVVGRELPAIGRRAKLAVAGLVAAAIALPIALAEPAAAPPAPAVAAVLPAPVAREQAAGVVTIVEFLDFECPFCRALAGRLSAAVARAGRPVRIVRKMVPLRVHPHAMPAAIAWCGAEAQGQGDAMAAALFAAPVEALTAEGCERIAGALGLDLAAYRAACADPTTRARIAADLEAARTAGVRLLPTVFVGATQFVGAAATEDDLVAAIRGA